MFALYLYNAFLCSLLVQFEAAQSTDKVRDDALSPPQIGDLTSLSAAQRDAVVPPVGPDSGAAVSNEGGNRWVRRMFKMPADMVTGSSVDTAALADGTFSDEVRTGFISPR